MAKTALEQLYILTVPEVQKIFLQVMQNIVDRAMIEQMVIAIEEGDVEKLFQVSGFTPAVLAPIVEKIEQVYKDAANMTVEGWPSRVKTPLGLTVIPIFNVRNFAVEEELRSNSSALITRISDEIKQNIRFTLSQGQSRGDNPKKTALDIAGRINPSTKKREGGIIGLQSRQVQWVESARSYLEKGDKRYFTLGLRDKRFDKIVLKSFEQGIPLKKDDIEKLLTAYKSRSLKYRAEMISRTEVIQSINRAENRAHVQGIEEGLFSKEAITKEWDDTGDRRTRTTHAVMGSKYGRDKGIPFDQPFLSPSGAEMLYPGDKSLDAPAEEIINCRCKATYRVDWLK